jgi:Family of unknown function (DUF5989)
MPRSGQTDFDAIAHKERHLSFGQELWNMVRHKKKYWMAPIIIVLLLLGLFVVLSTTAVAPFIYTLF